MTFSPRVWGWSESAWNPNAMGIVFPTRVGMVRDPKPGNEDFPRFPHACGDGPYIGSDSDIYGRFSPRVWGWSGFGLYPTVPGAVFPTRVGMVRAQRLAQSGRPRFPHACGDGPNGAQTESGEALFSPRVWGWSVARCELGRGGRVFPTRVGMVRTAMMGPERFLVGPGQDLVVARVFGRTRARS